MRANIAFYVHHHGTGHLMRCLAISKEMRDCKVTFLGSSLRFHQSIIPEHINCIDLPLDVASEGDQRQFYDSELKGLHYAPLTIAGQRSRTAMLTKFFNDAYPLLLVVDVSVEVAMLARLCGIPTVVVRQHGKRTDLPHEIAYRNAVRLLAPYGAVMSRKDPEWLLQKTIFTGGFSRFDGFNPRSVIREKYRAAVLVGSGGTSINIDFLRYLCTQCPEWTFEAIGKIADSDAVTGCDNLRLHGHLDDPLEILSCCEVVVGNAGHNTVMEVAALNKKFIAIPETRPFFEQVEKAEILANLRLAKVIHPQRMFKENWNAILSQAAAEDPDWSEVIDRHATTKAAASIIEIFNDIYQRD